MAWHSCCPTSTAALIQSVLLVLAGGGGGGGGGGGVDVAQNVFCHILDDWSGELHTQSSETTAASDINII